MKDSNHLFYWIENNYFCETYQTIRGRRYRVLAKLDGFNDNKRLTDDEAKAVFLFLEKVKSNEKM